MEAAFQAWTGFGSGHRDPAASWRQLAPPRKAPPPEPRSRRGLWITLGVVVALLVLAAAGWAMFGREKPLEVRTASTVALGNNAASASVLDASGYVVARRMATVSAPEGAKSRISDPVRRRPSSTRASATERPSAGLMQLAVT